MILRTTCAALLVASGCANKPAPTSTATATATTTAGATATASATPTAMTTTTTTATATATATSDGGAWVLLDGAPDPAVKLVSDRVGSWNFSVQIPPHWRQQQLRSCTFCRDSQEIGVSAGDFTPGDQTAGGAVFLATSPQPDAALDKSIGSIVKSALGIDITWEPRRAAKLGPGHRDVLAARGRARAGDWDYWQVVVPTSVAAGHSHWLVAGVKNSAAGDARAAVTAMLRSLVWK